MIRRYKIIWSISSCRGWSSRTWIIYRNIWCSNKFTYWNNYCEGTFTGVENITWSYHGQAAGEYEIDGNGFLLRRASDSYLEATFPNGIKSLSFDYRKAYTGGNARQLEVLINGEVKTTSESFGSGSGEDATVYNLTVEVNVEESVTVRIKLTGIAATNRHAVIDNFTWTTNPS